MALLRPAPRRPARSRPNAFRRWGLVVLALRFFAAPAASAEPTVFQEYQVKAVFLFNFAQFVDWPVATFPEAQSPIVIGVLGQDPFAGALDAAVQGEQVNGRSFVVHRYRRLEEVGNCQILFISRSETARLPAILAALRGRNILTVSDAENFTEQGGMIRFVTEQNKVRFRINLEPAKAANLTLSSKLLRPASVVTPGKG